MNQPNDHGHAYTYNAESDVWTCERCPSVVLDPDSSAAHDAPCNGR